MNVIIFGATGMVGQSVLRECLLDPEVQQVTTVGRTPVETIHSKLRNIVHQDMWNYAAIESELAPFDACFFCLGVSVAGKTEAEYEHITHDITLAAAETLLRLNPRLTFIFVSAAGADSSEKGRIMWARIKGKTENALLRLPFQAAYMFRPGAIEPLHGIESKTKMYRIGYKIMKPIMPLLRRLLPGHITTTEQLGRVMLAVARRGAAKPILESSDICAFSV